MIRGGLRRRQVIKGKSSAPQVLIAAFRAPARSGASLPSSPPATSARPERNALEQPVELSADWDNTSVAQTYAGDRGLEYRAGRAFGATSTINGPHTQLY